MGVSRLFVLNFVQERIHRHGGEELLGLLHGREADAGQAAVPDVVKPQKRNVIGDADAQLLRGLEDAEGVGIRGGEDGRFPMWMDPENVTAAVNDLLGNPFLPDLLKRLRRIRPIDRIRLPEPCASELAGVRLTAAPILAWREGVDCRFLTFESHGSVDTVLCRFALERLKLGPDRVNFLRWDGREEPAMRLDFSAELDHIAVSAARMYNGDYPKTADRAVCARCRYRDCCDG